MNKNSYSLLSSKWMFSGETGNILMPFLMNMLNGNEVKEQLNKTGFFTVTSSSANFDPFSLDEPTTSKEEKVGIIQVHHPIFKYDQFCGPKGTQTIISILESWKNDETIIGVVMDYNSGGGQASGTTEAANYIFEYSKPIVSYTNDIVGSAAYYMYAAAKHRIANKYADFIGCIGTMIFSIDLTGVIEKAGGKVNELYSDLSPEKNLQSRKLKEGDERPVIEKLLNPDAELFHSDMKKFLPNVTERALKGDIFSPEEAIAEGLVDSLGTLQDAIDKVFELSKANKKSNSKSNTNNMAKSLPRVEAVLGLDAPLASTDNGSYLNEEQLDTIENRLETMETENSNLQTQLDDANANHQTAIDAVNAQLTEATNNATAVDTSVNAIMENLGLSTEGSLTEKLAALNAKAETLGKADGAQPTKTKVDTGANPEASNIVGGVDVSAALNN